ncbi:hypothetical protein EHS25_007202 [Saitozyma podzolica]|uniref:Uncharacterized protein n=1 Tax=Saitozyma podzolica TaxID=1890683 RepID=A0A427XN56_9TREE|nr:hypothetical protein EHS25_007202 [Saitozyma podzolica]
MFGNVIGGITADLVDRKFNMLIMTLLLMSERSAYWCEESSTTCQATICGTVATECSLWLVFKLFAGIGNSLAHTPQVM